MTVLLLFTSIVLKLVAVFCLVSVVALAFMGDGTGALGAFVGFLICGMLDWRLLSR